MTWWKELTFYEEGRISFNNFWFWYDNLHNYRDNNLEVEILWNNTNFKSKWFGLLWFNGHNIEFYDDILFSVIVEMVTLIPKYCYIKLTLNRRN